MFYCKLKYAIYLKALWNMCLIIYLVKTKTENNTIILFLFPCLLNNSNIFFGNMSDFLCCHDFNIGPADRPLIYNHFVCS